MTSYNMHSNEGRILNKVDMIIPLKKYALDIKESLHSWDKAHLVMVYDFFNMLLDSVC